MQKAPINAQFAFTEADIWIAAFVGLCILFGFALVFTQAWKNRHIDQTEA
jgi:hypothetical protein